MGRVRPDNTYVRVEERCACDHRCTNATGPNCDFQCGGVNHGTHRIVQVVVESGKVSVKPRTDLEQRLSPRS
jgi:hypothetical protein